MTETFNAGEDDDFAALFQASVDHTSGKSKPALKSGQVVRGPVVQITKDDVFVDIGAKSEARIPRVQLEDAKGELTVKLGDVVRANVSNPRGPNGPELVVRVGRGAELDVEALELAQESQTPVEGLISQVIKGGVEVEVAGVRAFCPQSQLDIAFVPDAQIFVGQRHFFAVLEVRDRGRSVVLSRRKLLEQERAQSAEDLLARLEVGQELTGIVQSIQSYGAFVDLGGVQGLVHVSELSHRPVQPHDVVSVGDQVRVKVLGVETPSSGKARDAKVSLSMKALAEPDESVAQAAPQTLEVLEGVVSKVETFGVIVNTPKGSGLVPLRELVLPHGSDVKRAYTVGQEIQVVSLPGGQPGKLRFSARRVGEVSETNAFQEFKREQNAGGKRGLGSMADLLRGKLDELSAATSAPSKSEKKATGKQPEAATLKLPKSAPERRRS